MNRYILYFFSLIFIIITIFNNFNDKIPYTYANQRLETTQAERAILQAEYDRLQVEMAALEKQKDQQKGQSASIDRDIAVLKTKIKKSQLDIQAKNLLIKKLGGEILEKNKKINVLNTKISAIRESLSQLIRKDREIGDSTILSLILSKKNISDAYGDINAFASIKKSIAASMDEIRGVKTMTEEERRLLEEKKNKETDTKVQLETTKKEVETDEKDKQQLLSISKNKEAEYQRILNEKAKRRAEILAVLFDLRDNAAIPFGKALEYANLASSKTGIRASFILGILQQESNLGTNQGSCYVTNLETGAGVSKKGTVFNNVMKPMGLSGRKGDTDDFVSITKEVGRDPYKTLVSCPFSYGYGGAMGPSQIIPTTWQGLKKRVSDFLGIKTPDPWSPKDAIMATAVYLQSKGAVAGSYTSERTAACNYYAGSGGCPVITAKSTKLQRDVSYYGDSVMAKAKNIQETMINPLQD